jgi:hypothetical protein
MMRQQLTFAGILLFAAVIATPIVASAGGFAEPILLTSCGQAADVLMMKTLLTRDSLNFSYMQDAKASDVAGNGSIILVVGGSSKGLGAAKISTEDETARVSALLEAAHKANVPVLVVHLGGMNRRGPLSDPFNQLGASGAAKIIVVKGGNDDGFFTKIAEDRKIPIETVDSALSIAATLKVEFGTAK